MSSPRYAPPVEQGSSSSSHGSSQWTPDTDSEDDLVVDDVKSGRGIRLQEWDVNKSRTPGRGNGGEQDTESDDDEDTGRGRGRRRLSTRSFELYTPDEETVVLRKLDRRLVSLLALLYLLSFLDRSNIGNARIAGLTEDLALTSSQYQWLLTAFYITYILFEWMTLLYRVVPASVYIPVCVFAWGMLAACQAVSVSFGAMLVLRALLGISEAAFGPGVPFYLSMFFRRDELAFRTGLFISAAPLASSFASSLAYAIVRLGDRAGGIRSWRLLFFVEGFPSVLVAVAAWAWRWLPDSPETASWLSARERRIAGLRLRREGDATAYEEKAGSVGGNRRVKKLDWGEIARTVADPKCYLTAAIFFSCNVAFSSMPVFAPTIIKEMGYSSRAAQGLSAPPYLYAFAIVLLSAVLSDRFRTRSIPIAVHGSMAMCGYLVLAAAPALHLPNALRYLCIFPITAGFFSAVTITIVWTLNNQQSDEGKGTGIAILNIIGQLGPLLGTRLYPDGDAPGYVRGHAICAGFMCLVAVLSMVLRVVLKRANRQTGAGDAFAERRGDNVPLVGEEGTKSTEGGFLFML